MIESLIFILLLLLVLFIEFVTNNSKLRNNLETFLIKLQ